MGIYLFQKIMGDSILFERRAFFDDVEIEEVLLVGVLSPQEGRKKTC